MRLLHVFAGTVTSIVRACLAFDRMATRCAIGCAGTSIMLCNWLCRCKYRDSQYVNDHPKSVRLYRLYCLYHHLLTASTTSFQFSRLSNAAQPLLRNRLPRTPALQLVAPPPMVVRPPHAAISNATHRFCTCFRSQHI